jgi:hypothetical protein
VIFVGRLVGKVMLILLTGLLLDLYVDVDVRRRCDTVS